MTQHNYFLFLKRSEMRLKHIMFAIEVEDYLLAISAEGIE